MKSSASWAALLLAAPGASAQQSPPTPTAAPPADYRPSTGERQGQARYDEVGYAGWYGEETDDTTASGERFEAGAMTAAHATLALGSHAEVTALDSGKTILVRINDRRQGGQGRIVDLSRAAAQALGVSGSALAPVRVRAMAPSPGDAAALAAGRAAAPRADTPKVLLTALRRRLPAVPTGTVRMAPAAARPVPPAPVQPAPVRPVRVQAAPVRAGTRGFLVQVAALSSATRAQAVATRLGGQVVPAGRLYRIQLGPFADVRSAEAARAQAARQGFGDARVISSN